MLITKFTQRLVLRATCFVLLVTSGLPAGELEIETKAPLNRVFDVSLSAAGSVPGILVDGQGKPLAEVPIALLQESRLLMRTETDREGRFVCPNLRGGMYAISSPYGATMIRAWRAETAPPQAARELLIPVGRTVRAQCDGSGSCGTGCDACGGPTGGHYDNVVFRALSNPWFVGGVLAAAIVIPLATDNDDAS
jgi:hypothetical protein